MTDSSFPVTLVPVEAPRKHHPFSPSKMNYLDECAGFEGKEGENEAAEQGTFLHSLMEQMLQQVIKGKVATTLEQLSAWVRAKHELADDEAEYLAICCRRVDRFLAKNPSEILIEKKLVVRNDDGTEFNSGYADVIFIWEMSGYAILEDFKFGWEPVRPASLNLQGQNYALGLFQLLPFLKTIGVEFLQPKLSGNPVGCVYERRQAFVLFTRLQEVIERAKAVKANPETAQQFMKAGTYCRYCARNATCSALSNQRALVVSKFTGVPAPATFKGLELKTPQDVALARYFIEIVEDAAEEVKKKAREMAEANDGAISCTLPDGTIIAYEIHERNADRSLGSAIEVADALKEICTPEEVLGAADLALGKLETIAKNAMVEAAKAAGQKLTKKAAWEQIVSLLETHGLLTRGEGKVKYLKLNKQQKQVT